MTVHAARASCGQPRVFTLVSLRVPQAGQLLGSRSTQAAREARCSFPLASLSSFVLPPSSISGGFAWDRWAGSLQPRWGRGAQAALPSLFAHISPLPTSTLTPQQTTPQRHSVEARPPGYRGKPSRGLSFPCPWTSIFFPFVSSLEGSPSRRPRPPVVSRAPGS